MSNIILSLAQVEAKMIKPVKWVGRLELLSGKDVRDIHNASLSILERTGLVMPLDPKKQEQAQDMGGSN